MSGSSNGERLQVLLKPLKSEYVPALKEVEKRCFDVPWPEGSLEKEIENEKIALFITAWIKGEMAGYVGSWVILDELHINTVAVDPPWRGSGLSLALVGTIMEEAVKKGCRWGILEVSVNNPSAIRLYEKFGFKKIGERKKYYDDGSNALVMWVGQLQFETFRGNLKKIKENWEKKICLSWE